MLDNLVNDRVEKWRNKTLFLRKSNTLKELNKELEESAKELDILIKRKKELYGTVGKNDGKGDGNGNDDEEDDDEDIENIENNNELSSEEISKKNEKIKIKLQIREIEGSIDGITRDLDLLNTDLEDLAQQLEPKDPGSDSTLTPNKNKKPNLNSSSENEGKWDEIGREIIDNFSLPQCQSLLWDQIGEKASLLEQLRAGQFEQQEAKESAKTAQNLADNISRQLAYAKADMQNKLQKAESQRVQDVWALLRTQEGVSTGTGSNSPKMSDGEMNSATLVAIHRAQDLEMELEGYINNDDKLNQINEEQAARINSLEATLLNIQLRAQLSNDTNDNIFNLNLDTNKNGINNNNGNKNNGNENKNGDKNENKKASECFESLTSVWNALGVTSEERTQTVNNIQLAGMRARESALIKAENILSRSQNESESLQNKLNLISSSLGQNLESFIGELPGIPSLLNITDRLLSMPILHRLTALRDAVDSATAVLTVRASGLEKLKERLLDTMSEMWLDTVEIPECLRNILSVGFKGASVAASQCMDEETVTDDSNDDIDEIAAFMVTSAVCIAQQLKNSNVILTELNITNWEKAMRTLNVTRAKLTTQMVAVRAETSELCTSLSYTSEDLLLLTRQTRGISESERENVGMSDSVNGSEGCIDIIGARTGVSTNVSTAASTITQAEEAAVELVLGSGVSNPPGSQRLLTAVHTLKSSLQKVKYDRTLMAQILMKYLTHLKNILNSDEKNEKNKDEDDIKINEKNFIKSFIIISELNEKAVEVKTQLIIQLKNHLKHTAGYSEGSENEFITSLLLLKSIVTPPGVILELNSFIKELNQLSSNTNDTKAKDEIQKLSSSWGGILRGKYEQEEERTIRTVIMQVRQKST